MPPAMSAIRQAQNTEAGVRFSLHRFRQRLAQNLEQLPAANDYVALVQGLTVGVTNNVPREHWQSLRLSGTAHLLAISGLHIGLVSGWCYFFAGFVWAGFRLVYNGNAGSAFIRPVFALGVGLLGACIYAALAGFSLPTQRALIMLTVFSSLIFFRSVWPPGSALILALFVVLIVDPLAVLSIGFWLSFGTVAALFYLHQGRIIQSGKVRSAVSVHLKLGCGFATCHGVVFSARRHGSAGCECRGGAGCWIAGCSRVLSDSAARAGVAVGC